jgi:hypothetical protein
VIGGVVAVLAAASTESRMQAFDRNASTTLRGKVIRTVASIHPKIRIRTRVSDGQFESEIL